MLLLHVYLLLTRVRQADLDALWWLYENTGGASWRHNENWDREKVARSSTCHSAPWYLPNGSRCAAAQDPCRRHAARVPYRFDDAEVQPYHGESVEYQPSAWYGVGCTDPCDDYLDGDNCTAGNRAGYAAAWDATKGRGCRESGLRVHVPRRAPAA